MRREFVSEPISPAAETYGTAGMSAGGPGLPGRFTWRGAEYEVAELLDRWRETGPCTSGSDERYVRRHCFRVRTTDGAEMVLYFERRARSAREKKRRWWLYTVEQP